MVRFTATRAVSSRRTPDYAMWRLRPPAQVAKHSTVCPTQKERGDLDFTRGRAGRHRCQRIDLTLAPELMTLCLLTIVYSHRPCRGAAADRRRPGRYSSEVFQHSVPARRTLILTISPRRAYW
jgi:hypothetical protein